MTDVETPAASWERYEVAGHSRLSLPDLLTDPRQDILLGTWNWLFVPERFPKHELLRARCVELLGELQPLPSIAEYVASFRARHFRPTMIGVHVRRGDSVRLRPEAAGNSDEIMLAVERFLAHRPDAGILLCTDDGGVDQWTGRTVREGVSEIFRRRYGERVVETTPRTLDRRAPEAIQDALVDLLLLRDTDAFVATYGSSFSELAVFGRSIPHVYVAGSLPPYRRLERLARLTGIYCVLRGIILATYGDVPWPAVWRRVRFLMSSRSATPKRRW
jgi:hypothetical protein